MHYGLEEIQDYLQEQLPEDEAAGLEMHMAACQECAAMARALERRTSEWAGFTAAAHGAMLWRERVERHLQTPTGLFRVVRSAAGDAARFVVESLDAALRIAPLFPMQPAPAPGLATQTSAAAPSGHAVLGKPGGPSVIAEASASELRIQYLPAHSFQRAP